MFLQYALAAIIAFSGLLAGVRLARSAKEEMRSASRYLPWLQKILFIFIAAFFLNSLPVPLPVRLLAYALLILSMMRKRMPGMYPLIGIIFFWTGQSEQGLLMVSTLTFLYGFPVGSLFAINAGKNLRTSEIFRAVLLKHWAFPVVAVGLQAIYSLLWLRSFN